VEAGGAKRREVFKFVKRAYDVRSTIVHGGTPEKKDLKNVAGEKVELQAFADEATEIVRRLLRQVTEEIEDTGRFAVDWEVQLLGEE
jgi:Apea-like HEPN